MVAGRGEMVEPYEGDQPYAFLSYAHADSATVMRFVDTLDAVGYRVWYDAGIKSGSVFPDYIARRIDGCACMVVFVSRPFASSNWCRAEVHRAFSKGKPILPVYLERTKLSGGMEMQLGAYQALRAWQFWTLDALFDKISREPILEQCLREKDRTRLDVIRMADGVVSRNTDGGDMRSVSKVLLRSLTNRTSGEIAADTNKQIRTPVLQRGFSALSRFIGYSLKENEGATMGLGGAVPKERNPSDDVERAAVLLLPGCEPEVAMVSGVHSAQGSPGTGHISYIGSRKQSVLTRTIVKRKSLSDYSWAELEEIADRIASAHTDGEGLEIAVDYGIVDQKGRLRGDTKPVTLADGRRSSVRIAGFRHDDRADGEGKAGITFEFADVLDIHSMSSSRMDEFIFDPSRWKDSEMREYLNGELINLLPQELRSRIVRVRKLTNNYGIVDTIDASAVCLTEDRLWLLSLSEVYGSPLGSAGDVPPYPAVYDAEGTQYGIYADQGVTAAHCGFCKKSGAYSWWWLRSKDADWLDNFCFVDSDGDWDYCYTADRTGGVSPCFCF